MKNNVLLMAGLLTVALAGSAQAAGTMFAVQDNLGNDKFTVSDQGVLNEVNVSGKIAASLSNAPGSVSLTTGQGVLHIASKGNILSQASSIFQHVTAPLVSGGATFGKNTAQNMSFYRIDQNDVTLAYSHPAADASLGFFNFGTIDPTADPTGGSNRRNLALFAVRAEGAWNTLGTTPLNNPTYYAFLGTHFDGTKNVTSEKMRLTSVGRLDVLNGVRIGTINTTPTPQVASPKPTCDASTRGTLFNILGAAGTADQLVFCTYTGSAYNWQAITLGAVIP